MISILLAPMFQVSHQKLILLRAILKDPILLRAPFKMTFAIYYSQRWINYRFLSLFTYNTFQVFCGGDCLVISFQKSQESYQNFEMDFFVEYFHYSCLKCFYLSDLFYYEFSCQSSIIILIFDHFSVIFLVIKLGLPLKFPN